MRILELGAYIVPAYAGMLLAEQGHEVEKWTLGQDPIQRLRRGDELWAFFNAGKTVVERHVADVEPHLARFDAVVDNLRADALVRWGIDPARLAEKHGITWTSLRSEVDGRSFDIIAQARSWMEYTPHVPFYVGDTVGGLFLAFKTAAAQPGHHVIGHASCLQKLVEGELAFDVPRRPGENVWWDEEVYRPVPGGVQAEFKGEVLEEPVRDRAWKLAHLFHDDGRIRV